jgi:hypothetical protein
MQKCFQGLSQKEIGKLRRIHEHILKNFYKKEKKPLKYQTIIKRGMFHESFNA